MITLKEALEWSKKYMARGARKTHPDHEEYMRRTEYMTKKLYSDFEKQIAELEAQLLSNTEQVKTCDGCKHEYSSYNSTCAICNRYRNIDCYEPKETT